jgi:hypothetical protein
MKIVARVVAFVLVSSCCHAQYNSPRNNVWAALKRISLDFNTGSPVFDTSAIWVGGGTATVCDTFGRLLFYSDGAYVYDRKHELMPNGFILPLHSGGTDECSQPAVIVPMPDDTGRYYLFARQSSVTTFPMHYHIVDMSLNGGYGDVVSTTFIASADSLSDKTISVTGNNHNVWVLTHKRDTNIFLAYNVTASGVDTVPVVSVTGHFGHWYGYWRGMMKVSHDRRKLVLQSFQNFYIDTLGTELFDFDPATGKVSNCVLLDSTNNGFGAEFSPDNTKLYCQYATSYDTSKIYQFDLSLPTLAAVRSSKTWLHTNTRLGADLKLAPNGKIYCTGEPTSVPALKYLDVINSPNNAGTACGYVPRVIALPPGKIINAPFSNLVWDVDTVAIPPTFTASSVSQKVLAVYPNPANQMLRVEAKESIGSIAIFDAIGRELISIYSDSHRAEIDVRKLAPGNYWLRVDGAAVRQFVKQ